MAAVTPDSDVVPRPGRRVLWRGLAAFLVVVLITGAAVSKIGLLELGNLRDTFAAAGGGNTIDLPDVTPAEAGKPQTIMLLGTDGRLGDDEGAGQRSDTIILARLNAKKSAITLMSIPRDLKVTLPGSYGTDKINAAFAIGGTSLTLKTVKQLLSRPGKPFGINHVVQIDFTGFRRLVDYLNCTYIDVDRHYFNDQGGPGGYAVIDVKPGYQKVCGEKGLSYVRYRHTDNDLVRGARQQDFLRQLLRGRSVRRKLSFSQRETLARLAGRFTRTDNSLVKSDTALLSLLKLGLGVADKPVQQVTFGAGQIQDDGNYLIASDAAIDATLDQFLRPKTVTEETAKRAPESTPARKGPSKDKGASVPAGLVDVGSAGEDMAIAVSRRLRFPFYYPKLGYSTSSYSTAVSSDAQPRVYTIRANGRRYQAYRLVVSLGQSSIGQYYGIQGTTWKTSDPTAGPPILDGPHDAIVEDGRRLNVYYDGRDVRLVSWETKQGTYWVSNTLTRELPYRQMVAIARSLTRLGA